MIISKEDGAVDLSEFLNSNAGLLPVPIIITEPAVGFGGGLAVAYFHKGETFENEGGKGLSPTVSFLTGAYTSNKTWFLGGGHSGSYLNDRIRYLGVLAYISANLTFYETQLSNNSREQLFNMKGFLLLQELLYRIKKEIPFFMGFNYLYFNNQISFNTGINLPDFEEFGIENNTAGLNAVFLYDGIDNSLSPTKGIKTTFEIGAYGKALGGDYNYGNLDSRTYFFTPLSNSVFSGFRLQVASKWGDVPFFELPYISLRGIPALRYQSNNIYTVETEWRWNFVNRWSVVGFVGAGEALENYGDMFKDVKIAGGTGFRYLLAEQYGLQVGVDVSRGPEIWAWNLTVGSNWFR